MNSITGCGITSHQLRGRLFSFSVFLRVLFFFLNQIWEIKSRQDSPASDKTHKHLGTFAFLIGFESTRQRHPEAQAPLSTSAGGAGCGTQSLQKILLMYAELMTLIFFFCLPFYCSFLSAENSSGLHLGRKRISASRGLRRPT